ncbi:hypothetical protein F4811DRAFT_514280 [Daldinia bambusicola]|nr:hypothetical protein F4811DRAFT_514280 [Daldinia bambusicola]
MSALFNFQSLLLVILLLICTCAYVHQIFPAILDRNKQGFMGIFWKAARIGERLSPYMSLCCVFMAVSGALLYDCKFHAIDWLTTNRSRWLSVTSASDSSLFQRCGIVGFDFSNGVNGNMGLVTR